MASGISSPWGESPPMVAGLQNSLDLNNKHLTGELSLTSNSPYFELNQFVSPLTVKNKSYYQYSSFGKKSINNIKADINYLKKRF
jgi:hypothetical protein